MTRPAMIVDTETTSLTPDYQTGAGVIWELALIEWPSCTGRMWRMKPDLAKADASALAVGRFYERTEEMCRERHTSTRAYDLTRAAVPRSGKPEWSSPSALALEVARLLDNVTLIAANPTFDAAFLTAFLNHHGQAATWHYRLRDIGSMAYGWLCGDKPADRATLPLDAGTDDFAFALGLDLAKYDRHTALGDCRMVADMLAVIEGGAL